MVQVINCMNQEEFNNAIAQISGNNPELKEVKFSGLSGDINKINRLSDAIKINSTLTSIDLDENILGDAGAASIAQVLKVNTTLARVSLFDCEIKEEGAASIAEVLKENRYLTNIDLGGNYIDDAGAESIAGALKVNRALTSINLNDSRINNTGAASIAEALKENRYLTNIDLGDNDIDDAGAESIAGALKVNRTLTSINLRANPIKDIGAASIAEALKVNTALTSISLEENIIENAGAESIAEALKVNRTLTSINLRANQIKDIGAASIAEALKENRYLTSINLSFNNIDDTGAVSIAEALKVNRTLTSIDLGNNDIYEGAATSIAEALKVNTALTSIYLGGNFAEGRAEAPEKLFEALKVNRTLTSMSFWDHNHGPMYLYKDEVVNLAEVLEENNVITTIGIQDKALENIVRRNRQFLSHAVADSKEGKALTVNQQQTLLAHLSDDETNLFPINERKRFIENNEALFRERMVNITQDDKFEDPARNIAEFIGSIKDISNFNQRTSSDNKLQVVASRGDLGPALRLSNNRIFIDDALKNGMSSSEIKDNLNTVISDTKAHDYALTNPKKLGYLITLDKVQLDRAIEIINHKTLGKIIKEKPEQIAKLVKDLSISWSNSSSNSESLLNAPNAVKNRLRESDAETNEPKKKPRSH